MKSAAAVEQVYAQARIAIQLQAQDSACAAEVCLLSSRTIALYLAV